MLVLEIAAQGAPGAVPSSGRVSLRAGYNVVAADGRALRRIIDVLLSPLPGDGKAAAAPALPLRAGLTLVGNDGVTYRVVHGSGATELQRLEPSTRRFTPVSSAASDVAAHLAAAGVPSRERLDLLLSLRMDDLPSARARRAMGASPAGARERGRAEALRAELERAREVDELQQRLDALQTRLLRSDEALRALAQLRSATDQARAASERLPGAAEAERLLGDARARLVAAARAEARRTDELARSASARARLPDQETEPTPWWRLRALWGGLAGGTAAIALAVAGAQRSPGLRYLALLDVPAFGWAAWTALRWIGQAQEGEQLARRRRVLDDADRRAQDRHDLDTALVRQALGAAGAASVGELEDQLAALGDARREAAELSARLHVLESSPEVRDAREERGRLEEEIRDVEGRLTRPGALPRDVPSIEAELARLVSSQAASEAASGSTGARSDGVSGEPVADAVESLRSQAASALGGDPAQRLRELAARAGVLTGALSGGRLGLELDGVAARLVQGGSAVPESLARPPDRDLCFLATRLAVLERALAEGASFALLEDAFAELPETARRLVARILKAAAHGKQIVHATTDRAFCDAADHVAA